MDSACVRDLTDIAALAMPAPLADRVRRWDDLDEAEREVTRGDLAALAALARGGRG